MKKNYYQILGLEKGCTKEEIKSAYKLYTKKFHPDKQKGDPFFEERFREIKEAYEYLVSSELNEGDVSSEFSTNTEASVTSNKQGSAKEIHREITRSLAKDLMNRMKRG